MAGRGHWPRLSWTARDAVGNRRTGPSEYHARLERLRAWRRHLRRAAVRSVKRVRDDFPWRLIPLTAVTLAASMWYVSWRMPPAADPYYEQARHIVGQYELGKTYEMIDFNHPVYSRAMNLLEQVDQDSISVHEARRLKAQLERSVVEFRERREAKRQNTADFRKSERRRARSLELTQRSTTGVDRAAVFAHECEEDEVKSFEGRQDARADHGH